MRRSLSYNADGFCVTIENYTVFLHIQSVPRAIPLYPASAFARREGTAIPLADLLRVITPDLSAESVTKQIHHHAEILYHGRKVMQIDKRTRTEEEAQWVAIGDYKASIVWYDAQKMEWFVTRTMWDLVTPYKKTA